MGRARTQEGGRGIKKVPPKLAILLGCRCGRDHSAGGARISYHILPSEPR